MGALANLVLRIVAAFRLGARPVLNILKNPKEWPLVAFDVAVVQPVQTIAKLAIKARPSLAKHYANAIINLSKKDWGKKIIEKRLESMKVFGSVPKDKHVETMLEELARVAKLSDKYAVDRFVAKLSVEDAILLCSVILEVGDHVRIALKNADSVIYTVIAAVVAGASKDLLTLTDDKVTSYVDVVAKTAHVTDAEALAVLAALGESSTFPDGVYDFIKGLDTFKDADDTSVQLAASNIHALVRTKRFKALLDERGLTRAIIVQTLHDIAHEDQDEEISVSIAKVLKKMERMEQNGENHSEKASDNIDYSAYVSPQNSESRDSLIDSLRTGEIWNDGSTSKAVLAYKAVESARAQHRSFARILGISYDQLTDIIKYVKNVNMDYL